MHHLGVQIVCKVNAAGVAMSMSMSMSMSVRWGVPECRIDTAEFRPPVPRVH